MTVEFQKTYNIGNTALSKTICVLENHCFPIVITIERYQAFDSVIVTAVSSDGFTKQWHNDISPKDVIDGYLSDSIFDDNFWGDIY